MLKGRDQEFPRKDWKYTVWVFKTHNIPKVSVLCYDVEISLSGSCFDI